MDVLQHDLDAYFNLLLVTHGARKAFLLETHDDFRQQFTPEEYIDIIAEVFPNLYVTPDIYPNRYWYTVKPLNHIPQNDVETAKLLEFDCLGIEQTDTYYVLQYFVSVPNGPLVNFYSEICPTPDKFLTKDSKLDKFQKVADQFGYNVRLEIEKKHPLNARTFEKFQDYWISNPEDFYDTLEGNGITYLHDFPIDQLLTTYKPLLLFTLLRLEHDPFATYYPLSPEEANELGEWEQWAIQQTQDPIEMFEILHNEFVVNQLGETPEYDQAKQKLYKEYNKRV